MRTNFLRISGLVGMILILAAVGLANSRVQASQPAQATGTISPTGGATVSGTVSATTSPGTGGGATVGGGAAPAAGTALPTALATIGGEEAFPPCPQPILPTLPATASAAGGSATQAAGTSATGGAATAMATI